MIGIVFDSGTLQESNEFLLIGLGLVMLALITDISLHAGQLLRANAKRPITDLPGKTFDALGLHPSR